MKCLATLKKLRRDRWLCLSALWSIASIAFFGVVLSGTISARAGVTPPILNVCEGLTCDDLKRSICSDLGFRITLTNFIPAPGSDCGCATYTYQICVPPLGMCTGGPNDSKECAQNGDCQSICMANGHCSGGGQPVDCSSDADCTVCVIPMGETSGTCNITGFDCNTAADCQSPCNRDCAVDKIQSLSHLDVLFPPLGDIGGCLTAQNEVSGTCACTEASSDPPTGNACAPQVSQSLELGDSACFDPGTSNSFVAKCNDTVLVNPGDCIEVNLMIAGETNGLGLGKAIVVDKAATECTASCIAGPSCEPCDGNGGEGECLTRTRGFWGTHPDITSMFDPVTVCGYEIDGQDPLDCSTSEALCTSALDYHQNTPYLALIAQLTAAKLNLNATAYLIDNGTTPDNVCSGFTYQDKTIQEWIEYCEGLCGKSKNYISNSGCIEALDAFNQDKDTGFDVTPAPFDHPGPADPTQCNEARGNGQAIGHDLCTDNIDQVEGASTPKPKPGKPGNPGNNR
jgi:hypothetical protein